MLTCIEMETIHSQAYLTCDLMAMSCFFFSCRVEEELQKVLRKQQAANLAQEQEADRLQALNCYVIEENWGPGLCGKETSTRHCKQRRSMDITRAHSQVT
jgi:hypothetical protein